jgi:hypothetical protein
MTIRGIRFCHDSQTQEDKSEYNMKIAGVEAVRNAPIRTVQNKRLAPRGPVARKGPHP